MDLFHDAAAPKGKLPPHPCKPAKRHSQRQGGQREQHTQNIPMERGETQRGKCRRQCQQPAHQ